MCGFIGSMGYPGRSEKRERALRMIGHRGPDSEGQYSDEQSGVWLAHTRLAILDLSETGSQPMSSSDGRATIVFNGEIYNFRELRSKLSNEDVWFRGGSDTEVVLTQYLRDGPEMLRRLNGVFALAIYDRLSGDLLLARDGLGVKPLYYCDLGGRFVFASEMKALFPFVPAANIDSLALHRYLTFQWSPGSSTICADVKKLLPGEAILVNSGRVKRQWSWYELPACRGVLPDLDEAASVTGVSSMLRTAVHRQMVADVPVGAFLSGGLDSSAIVTFAREVAPELRCFTIENVGGRDAGEADDLPYARQVAKHLGVSLDVVEVNSSDMAAGIEGMVYALDEPLGDPAPLNVLYISQLARKNGIKVLLSGAGGDDLFSGYRRHVALRYEQLWGCLPAVLRRSLAAGSSRFDQRSGIGRRVAKFFANASKDDDDRLLGYFAWANDSDLRRLFTPVLAVELDGVRADEPMRDFLATIPEGTSRLERMLALEQRFFLADHNLIYTDKMSMAAGVEVRVPFLDLELVDFAARVPDRFKQRGREGKWVLKKAMEPYLPREVIYRPKTGFGAPLRRWLNHELREMVGDILSVDSLRARGLFDPMAVQNLIRDTAAGRRDGAYTIFSLLCIEIWCRTFMVEHHVDSAHSAQCGGSRATL
ncbi:MAG: asparagine synthase (glutamine-hydrolyzing) [Burkholderiaceae bacterium]|nr:asparagine synthase (glutamine-hydrolyzing) [Burkholderiaceae bacterium]